MDHDFEEPTKVDNATMSQLMEDLKEELVRSPGVPPLTSERPTRPMRPLTHNNYERP